MLVGWAAIATGLFLMAAEYYVEETAGPGILALIASFSLADKLNDASLFILGGGVLTVGLGWSWNERQASVALQNGDSLLLRRRRYGLSIALTGVIVAAGGLLAYAVIEGIRLFEVFLPSPNWVYSLVWIFAGLGLVLWGTGWFLCRWPRRTPEPAAGPIQPPA